MSRSRIVVVGAGFAGFEAARALSRRVRGKAEIVLLNPTDYFLYLPLLPQVAAGILEPRRVTVSLPGALPRVLDAVLPRQAVQLGLVRSYTVPLDTASPELARVPGGPGKEWTPWPRRR